jgi:hypothetical protein
MTHILLNLNDYIDPWLNTRLVHDLYLKIMEGHLSMTIARNSLVNFFVIFFFCINKLIQVATLAGAVDISP